MLWVSAATVDIYVNQFVGGKTIQQNVNGFHLLLFLNPFSELKKW